MLNSLFSPSLTLPMLLLCLGAAAGLGILTALVFRVRSRTSAGFALTLSLLPMVVAMVILLVNGSVGTGVAVAGAFALVRFRSVPGTAREIAAIFTAMALGLALGMGYLSMAVLLFLLVAALTLLLTFTGFAQPRGIHRQLRVTIPENLDYDGLFDDVFHQFGMEAQLLRIKTTAMGTLFDLTYDLTVPQETVPKAFLDALRARNGNLSVVVGPLGESESL